MGITVKKPYRISFVPVLLSAMVIIAPRSGVAEAFRSIRTAILFSKKDREIETEEEFVAARKRHSSVESAINALEVHGLDRRRASHEHGR